MLNVEVRHDWIRNEIQSLFEKPFNDLVFHAHSIHRHSFRSNAVQISTLLNVKTGLCPENCSYCPQSGHYNTGLKKEPLMSLEQVKIAAKKAKQQGAGRFCIAAAWRSPPKKEFADVLAMVTAIKALDLEACATLGMLTEEQARQLAQAGLDYYNHNLDTSPEYYKTIISTRTYEERLQTLAQVRAAGINVCCGGIIGMGEAREDRIGLLQQLANLPEHPKSVTLNKLIPIPGTPLADKAPVDSFEFIRMVAVARIILPFSMLRLSAGRDSLNEEAQALCFFAGANSIHYGEKLLTTANVAPVQDRALLEKLGLVPVLADTELNAHTLCT
ncbi:biotin synthase BioB [Rickettsiella endosymbiont of Dermanyssus gallinae]|uniref:biotin synthase BioB n=1 Tax=Rickettsiella endosymbiont of Dermanyssus gallinae TaxID=2856608 RepID=UPI001C531D99|nr:biotin synthase BioB [Rickettsiella endosymbiont of Dermanyssus gallinae]